jgi:uncharacterized protein (TIGR02001 family)
MKLNKLALAVGALVLSGAAAAEFSANIAATSNYVWRGATQTDDAAAIQGGLDYAHDSGFYVGTWASNVDFGNGGEVEVDLYGGYSGEMAGVGYDVGVIYYAYPDSDDANFTEIALGVSFSMFSAGINYTIDSEVDDTAGAEGFIEGDLYYYAGASFEVAPTWTIGATIGYYDFEDDGVGGADLSYSHVQLDVTKSAGDFGDFTFSISKAGDEANVDGATGNPDDDIKVFVSWAKTFD